MPPLGIGDCQLWHVSKNRVPWGEAHERVYRAFTLPVKFAICNYVLSSVPLPVLVVSGYPLLNLYVLFLFQAKVHIKDHIDHLFVDNIVWLLFFPSVISLPSPQTLVFSIPMTSLPGSLLLLSLL